MDRRWLPLCAWLSAAGSATYNWCGRAWQSLARHCPCGFGILGASASDGALGTEELRLTHIGVAFYIGWCCSLSLCQTRHRILGFMRFFPCSPRLPTDTFILKTKKLYSDSRTQRNLDKLNSELRDVHSIMTKNINELLERGDRLERTLRGSNARWARG